MKVTYHLVTAPGGSQATVAEFVIDTLNTKLVKP